MKSARLVAALGAVALAAGLAGCAKSQPAAPAGAKAGAPVKIGFLVKQPEVTWFQLEWRFADQAARELGFTLVKIGATDGEKVLAAIDTLAADGAQGFVICTPDTRLGPSVAAKAKTAHLKLISVDDQFLGADGSPMRDVHHLGISAAKIGETVGTALAAELKQRGWAVADTAVCAVTFEELATARERTDGAIAALVASGFPPAHVFRAPQRTSDIPGAFDAVNVLLTQQPAVKHWLVCGMNDWAVLGAVRALEGRGFAPDSCAGIGINGTDCIDELEKARPTSFTRTTGVLITRENFRQVLKEQGIRD